MPRTSTALKGSRAASASKNGDAHTAILMREHGIRQIYSRDTDFNLFSFLEVLDPLETTAGVQAGETAPDGAPAEPDPEVRRRDPAIP